MDYYAIAVYFMAELWLSLGNYFNMEDSTSMQSHLPSLLAQAMAEYGTTTSLSSTFASIRDRIEMHIGQGNLKYVLIGSIVLLIILFYRMRR